MKASPLPEPVILELRNRWPFFSEGELKWLLSPRKEGALVHQQQEQQAGANMGATMDEDVCGGGGRRRSSVVVAEEDYDSSSSSSSSLSLQEGAGAHCAKVLFEDVASFFSEEEEEEEVKECNADSHHQEIHMPARELSTARDDDEEEDEEEVLLFLSSQQEAGVCSSAEKFCLGQDREKESLEEEEDEEENGDMNDGRRMEDEISLDKQEHNGCSSEEEQTYEQKLVELQSSRVEEEEEDPVLDQETEVCEVSFLLPQSLLSNDEQQPLEEAKSEEVAVVPNNDASCAEDMKTGNQIFAFRQQQQISTPQKVDDTGVTTIQSEEFGRLGPGAWMLPDDDDDDDELQTEISGYTPVVHADRSSESSLENRCASEDFCTASTSCFFPSALVECGHEFESGRELMDDDEEEQEDEEEVPDNCSVKRMSFDFSDGKRIPKFFPEEVKIAINSGGSLLKDATFGFTFAEDDFFTGGDVLRTEEIISGVQKEEQQPCLYQTARYGDLSYVFQDLPCGSYVVDLHFAEIIFTNGPPGMRVFDVSIQGQRVIAELDVFAEVGSNSALILSATTTVSSDGTLAVVFEGVIGSPTISAICVRSGQQNDLLEKRRIDSGAHSSTCTGASVREAPEYKGYQQEVQEKDQEIQQITEYKSRRQQMKSKSRKCVREYESKLEELKNECHEAWITLQDSNRINEMLRDDLVAKSLCVDSLATAVEIQVNELNAIKDRAAAEKKRWIATLVNAFHEIQALKHSQKILSQQANDWISSLPDINVMSMPVQALGVQGISISNQASGDGVAVNQHQELRKMYAEGSNERRQLYNKVLELKGNIRVFCRCRPLSVSEVAAGVSSVAEFELATNGDLVIRTGTAGKKLFKFDRVFSPQDDQADVFADTAPVVVSVLDGYNVCIFAYGQTGTGKTFTMEGYQGNRGVNYRTLEELFNVASQRRGQVKYEISVSVMEVYNEQIRDLLAPPPPQDQAPKKLEIKQMVDGGHHVPGLVEAQVQCMEEVWEVLQTGSSSRTVGSTRANDRSSRSHCMLCVMVKGENLITGECTRSKLWLVDLAGSERVAKSDAQGDRLKEAQSINKSLSALGDVIQALTTKSSHIPFRNSKLTHLLQDSLGGDSKTLMFVQISPNDGDVGETLCSLNFASRVRGVELGPARKQLDSGELFKYKQLAERAKQEGRSKEEAVKKLEDSLRNTEAKLKAKEQICQTLTEKVKENAELELQVLTERRARQAAEASLHEQKLLAEKIMADMTALAEKAAMDSKQAIKEALEKAAIAHAHEVARVSRMNDSPQVNNGRQHVNVMDNVTAETTMKRPPLVETGPSSRPPISERTVEYAVNPPDGNEVMRNSCTGEVFGNENSDPQDTVSSEGPLKQRGILKSSSPTFPKRVPGRVRRSGFGVCVKPSVLVSSLVRRSQEVASQTSSVAASLSEEELHKLVGGLDLIATSNLSALDSSLQSLAQALETTPATRKKQQPLSRMHPQKTVHFRSPLLVPPPATREGAKCDDIDQTNQKPILRSKPTAGKPFGKTVVGPGHGAQRVPSHKITTSTATAPKPPPASQLREKRWNK